MLRDFFKAMLARALLLVQKQPRGEYLFDLSGRLEKETTSQSSQCNFNNMCHI